VLRGHQALVAFAKARELKAIVWLTAMAFHYPSRLRHPRPPQARQLPAAMFRLNRPRQDGIGDTGENGDLAVRRVDSGRLYRLCGP